MKPLGLKRIAAALGAEYSGEDLYIERVSTDTRTIEMGDLFVCIKGENFDGHNFIEQAIRSGAAAIVSSQKTKAEVPVLLVDDTLGALLKVAALYRSDFNIKAVGVTGSVGKTSTKEMIYAALSAHYNTLKTEGNRNNEIGLPHTLFGLTEKHEAAVIEMGMVDRGEIDLLTRVVRPDVAVITNIGVSHIENLKTRENILLSKLEIENGLNEDGVMVLNGDNDLLGTVRGKLSHRCIFYGINEDNLDVFADNISVDGLETSFHIHYKDKTYKAKIPTIGEHNVLNALAAFSVCAVFGLDLQKSTEALYNFKPSGQRQKIYTEGSVTVIEDCYNASPDSMRASLWVLKNISASRRIAVLGDMLELGDISEESHREVGALASFNADVLFCFGEEARKISEEAEKKGTECYHFEDKKELSEKLKNYLKDGDAVLFKASRGMRFEEIINSVFKGNGE